MLPRAVERVQVPPLKCQGIKTRLVPFILSSVCWDGAGRWIEPFLGSGVVLFNVAPPRAHAADSNEHIIRFYRDIAAGIVTPARVRDYLEREGTRLRAGGAEHYYAVRERLNTCPSSLDFLFLNRACFNGLIRFNRAGRFNVPFGRRPNRFSPAYVTKIVNQVAHVARLMQDRDWTFAVADWHDTLRLAGPHDFVYADPPYNGRHADYFSPWADGAAAELLARLLTLPTGFALSTWKQNRFRRNPALAAVPPGCAVRTVRHFYHVGAFEANRHPIEEALVIKNGFAAG
jgi:DNA adenine methylase